MLNPVPGPLLRRLPGRTAGSRPEDAVRVAAELAAAGHLVAFDHAAEAGHAPSELDALVAGVQEAGLTGVCELTVPVGLLGPAADGVAERALQAGLGAALTGPSAAVAALGTRLPAATVVVAAGEPDAEERCRTLAGGRVRLLGRPRRGPAADLAFVRCLNVLMAGGGHSGVGTSDPRLVAIAGERAAWNERSPGSWEYVMRWRERVPLQRRLLAGGYAVRVAVASGGER